MLGLQLGCMLHPALSPSFLEKAISKGEARGRSGLGSYRLQETFGQDLKTRRHTANLLQMLVGVFLIFLN